MTRTATLVLAATAALALAGCQKAQEKAAERAIESSMAKDGTQAKVNLSENSMKVTTTDASGKSSQMEIGKAQVTEADLGVPFYPGSKPTEGGAMRMATNEGSTVQIGLHSEDAPDKVAAFYRDKLKTMAAGKQMMDMSSNEGATLALADDKSKNVIQVHIAKVDKGSDIVINASRSGAK
jgi:hypothetical protein